MQLGLVGLILRSLRPKLRSSGFGIGVLDLIPGLEDSYRKAGA